MKQNITIILLCLSFVHILMSFFTHSEVKKEGSHTRSAIFTAAALIVLAFS